VAAGVEAAVGAEEAVAEEAVAAEGVAAEEVAEVAAEAAEAGVAADPRS
jgi:hypothetical protein